MPLLTLVDPDHRALLPLHAAEPARVAHDPVHPHRAGEGPLARRACSTGTRSRTRCCRRSTVLGVQFGQLLGGVVVVERIFNWPGIGGLLIYSVERQDFNTLVACVMAIAAAYVVVSTLIEIALPRGRPADPEGLDAAWLRRNPRLQIGLLLLLPFLIAALIPGVIAPHCPTTSSTRRSRRPSAEYLARHGRARPRHPLAARLRRAHRPQDQPRRDADRGR